MGKPVDTKICLLMEKEIHNLICERMQCRHMHEFEEADNILKEFMGCKWMLIMQAKLERAAEGAEKVACAARSTPCSDTVKR